jgi:hypothetical protein
MDGANKETPEGKTLYKKLDLAFGIGVGVGTVNFFSIIIFLIWGL